MTSKKGGYLGNLNLKQAGIDIQFTEEQVQEYIKCSKDPVYFIEKYIKVVSLDEGLVPFKMYDYQQDIVEKVHDNRFVIAKLPRQSGKALATNTPINTPNGWSTMGELEIGDEIYGADGKPTKIIMATEVMYNHDCYEIEFDNGEIITADKDHLWTVGCSDWRDKKKTLTTKEILEYLPFKLPDRPIYIDTAKPIENDDIELPIDPYTLGVWLGDGYSSSGRYISEKSDNKHIRTKIIDAGYDVADPYQKDNCEIQTIYKLQTTLKECNVFENKRIPRIYFDASVEQRLELLRGLMDTDGYCDKKGACEFYQKPLLLTNEVRELISGLGMKPRMKSKMINGEVYYTLVFTNEKYEVFSLPRKLERQQRCLGHPKNNRHYIKKISKTNSVPVRCIQVDNEDKLFLCGRTMIPTHNSTTMISYLLHYVLFNQSMTVAVLANKQTTAREILGRLKLAYEYLPLWIQQGIIEWNKGSIELENGSRIIASSTSASAVRGGSYNCIFLDEFAHVPHGIAEDFFSSVYPTVTSGKTTKVLMVSTPNGLNMFYHYWRGATKEEGQEGKNEYIPIEVDWRQVPLYPGGPLRDDKWKEETIANTSEQQFQSEFICDFIGSQHTLISSYKLKSLAWIEPIFRHKEGLTIYEEPIEDHIYVCCVDTARGQGKDYSALSIVDITQSPYKVVAKYRNNIISPMVYPTVIKRVCEQYNEAYCLIEINDIGSQVADVLYVDLEYPNVLQVTAKGRKGQTISGGFGKSGSQLGVKTTAYVKKLGCSVLKSLIEEDRIIIEDMDIINELVTFVAKKQSFEADDGHNDDLVMTLVLFSWLTRQEYFKNITDEDIRTTIYEEKIAELEEEMSPFGFIVDSSEANEGEWDGENRWYNNETEDTHYRDWNEENF